MKKTIFTNPRWITGQIFALTLLATLLFSVNSATAQCSLAINDEINVSLDAYVCETEITPDMVLEDPDSCDPNDYVVMVTDLLGVEIPNSPFVNHEYIGQTLLVYVMDNLSNNMSEACEANIFDKMAPVWVNECPEAVNIYCYELDDYSPEAYDACDNSAVSYIITDKEILENPCISDTSNQNYLDPDIIRVITREFVAVDSSGNQSAPCEVDIYVWSLPRNAVIGQGDFPDNYPPELVEKFAPGDLPLLRFPEDKTFSCEDCSEGVFAEDPSGCCIEVICPTLESTGYPFLRVPVVTFDGLDQLTITYDTLSLEDPYENCGFSAFCTNMPYGDLTCNKQFMKMWDVYQDKPCGPIEDYHGVQMISVVDENDPTITCPYPDGVEITTNSEGVWDGTSYGTVYCGATFQFPVPEMDDACSSTLTWDISVANDMGAPIEFMDNADVLNPPYRALPLGENTVTYTVYDVCGNSASCDFLVTVVDETAPVAVCQQYTTVGLTYDGFANVYAHSFDSGSYDDCALDYIEVKRMDDGANCGLEVGDGDVWKDHVTFCCADVGRPVTVQFRVWDIAGNYNECMVQVDVQDKLAPVLTCPPDMEVNCDFFYDLDNMDAYFGAATPYDNCDVDLTQDEDVFINQCGIGYIIRYFTATDPGGRTATCEQRIDFVNYDPFWINQGWPADPDDDVDWPDTYYGTGCLNPADLHPDVTGRPVLHEGPCDLAGATWSDDVFFFNDDDANATEACFKIIRHWKVIDWCQHEPDNNGEYRKWTYDQIVMVSDPVGPTITSDCEDKTTCTYDPDCVGGYIELTMSATDTCTDGADLKWHYGIDFDNDNEYGSFDWDSEVINGANVQALGPDNNGEFPIGTHRIYWTVWDQCGNSTNCEYLFTIQNCKTPTPYCLDNIATTLMGIDTDGDGETDWGMIDVKAIDCAPCCLDAYHPCTYDIAISFSEDWEDTVRTFTCDDFGDNEVEIWATAFMPDGSVTQDYCVTTIDIQDNFDVCANGPDQFVQIAGMVQNIEGGAVEGVSVELAGSELGPQITNEDGTYSFTASANGSYSVNPMKDGDDTEGVTTLDLVLIQKHLLALKAMDSPYTLLAADVDDNGKVSAADLFTLRKLILGVNDSFENINSWAFIDGSYQFENPENPFNESVPDSYALNNVATDVNIDFIGVKMGDINHTVALNGGQDVMNRSQALTLLTDEQTFEYGQSVEVPVYAENFNDINGFQLTWTFDNNSLEFTGVEAGALEVNAANLGLTELNRGNVSMSWSEASAQSLSDGEVLFTLTFNAVNTNKVSATVQAGSSVTAKEAYNKDLSVIDLTFETRNAEMVEFELFQNTPNPFSSETAISFNLPEASFAKLKITDVTGRVIRVINGDFDKGLNTITLNKSDLNATGVLYYQLDSEGYTATKRMVVIQ